MGRSRLNENKKDKSVYVNKRVSQQERVRKWRDEDKDITGKKTDRKTERSEQKGIKIMGEKRACEFGKENRTCTFFSC